MLHIFVSALWFRKLGSQGATLHVLSPGAPAHWALPTRPPRVVFIRSEHGKPPPGGPAEVPGQQGAGPGAFCPPAPSPHSS